MISTEIGTTGVISISYPEVFPLSFLSSPNGHAQGLVINVAGQGLVMITGCGHPTMEKSVARAETLFGRQVAGVVGGLHYDEASTVDVQPHIQLLELPQPMLIAPSPHDSRPEAPEAFELAFPEAYRFIRVSVWVKPFDSHRTLSLI